LAEAWGVFVKSSDIATPTAAYVRWTPVFGYEWGRKIIQVLVVPIPSSLWRDKYYFFGVSPIDKYMDVGAAAALFAEFYVSFGAAGVVIGMAVLGLICRRVYDNYKANPQDMFARISLALLWAYLFHVYGRHLLAQHLYNLLYVFGPVWILRWLASRRENNEEVYAHQSATK
jgi:hypothetical protein